MKLTIDTDAKTITRQDGAVVEVAPLFGNQAFEWLSREWVRVGWELKYAYQFTWMGRPIIQMPEDMVRTQEIIYRLKPDVIIETGVAHGGSLIYYASLCKLLGVGRVIGIDIEIRSHNRKAIEAHEMAPLITLIEGNSVGADVVAQVRALIQPTDKVLVILDSCHTKQHVLDELAAYAPFVTPDSYLVATDGIMKDLSDVSRGRPDWIWNNPAAAAVEFTAAHPEFVLERPRWPFTESAIEIDITHWPSAWLRRK